jgi:hypothetical protein
LVLVGFLFWWSLEIEASRGKVPLRTQHLAVHVMLTAQP